jgi:23S rRNA pseudouridine1911/1915/1917 synthase
MKKKSLEIIYEDDNLIVVNKPAGVLTIPDRYDDEIPNLYHILQEKYGEIWIVHRLDKDTSGLIVFAKDPETHRDLSLQFEKHKVKKIYHVVIKGIFSKEEIDIDIPLIDDPKRKGKVAPSVRGKESLTKVKTLERFRAATLIEADLVTGRHHQIRAHCAAIGHPLLIDEMYGGEPEFFLSSIKRKFNLKKKEIEQPLLARVTMHAHEIEFLHPAKNEKMKFSAEYPKDFRALIQVLRKYSGLPEIYNSDYNFDF